MNIRHINIAHMKKKSLAIAVIVICISILASSTLAYFTDAATARNVITMGGVNIKVVEQQLDNGSLKPYPEDPVEIMPGKTVSKIVSVTSLEEPAWVRMAYTITVQDADGKQVSVPQKELNEVVIITPNTADWTLRDGWWYYSKAVDDGDATKPLFRQVHFSGPEMGNEYQNCSIIVKVVAQAVQKANNGTSALKAAGWPET